MTQKLDPKHAFHYGMTVPDMGEAVSAWEAIGAHVLMPPRKAEGVGVLCCIILYHDTILELVEAVEPDAKERMEQVMLRPGAIDHVAYFTDDMDADVKGLEESGGQVMLPETFNTAFDRNMAFVAMPTGFVIELMDRKAAGKVSPDPLQSYQEAVSAAYA